MSRTKIIIFSILLLSFSELATAQEYRFGLKTGLTIAKAIANDNEEYQPYIGFLAGVTGKAKFDNNIFIRTGIIITQKGVIELYNNEEIKARFNYIDIPLTIGYENKAFKNINYFVELGGYIGISVNQEFKYKDRFIVFDYDTKSSMSLIDGGIDIGIGLRYSNIELAINYLRGFVNIYDIENLEVYNQVLSISIILNFSIL